MSHKTRRYDKQWRLDRLNGIHYTQPAQPTSDHITWLRNHGATIGNIAAVAGVSDDVISRITHGQDSVRSWLADAIQGVTLHRARAHHDPDGYIPAHGTKRRIQALLAAGWRNQDITTRLTNQATTANVMLHRHGPYITRATYDDIAHVYTQLADREGPSHITRARAARAGYHRAAAWDDIDDPHENPATVNELPVDYLDWIAVERRAAGDRTIRLTKAEAAQTVNRLRAQGHTDANIARRTGLKTERYAPLRRDLEQAS